MPVGSFDSSVYGCLNPENRQFMYSVASSWHVGGIARLTDVNHISVGGVSIVRWVVCSVCVVELEIIVVCELRHAEYNYRAD